MAAVSPSIPASPAAITPIEQGSGTQPQHNVLHNHPQLWRASSQAASLQGMATPAAIATGQPVLDAELAGNGWPTAGLTEFLHNAEGIGELRLLLPALAHLSRTEHKWIAWVNPPHMPCGPALAAAGVDVDRLLIIHPKNHKEALWCMEQAMKSGTCSAVLGWPDAAKLQPKDVRRLQVAARQGGTSAFLFRPEAAAQASSPAELRLQLCAGQVRILKRRGGWATDWLTLDAAATDPIANRNQSSRTPAEHLQDQLTLWRHQRPNTASSLGPRATSACPATPRANTQLTESGLRNGQLHNSQPTSQAAAPVH